MTGDEQGTDHGGALWVTIKTLPFILSDRGPLKAFEHRRDMI